MKWGRVWIGTSGWVYKEWAGHFYPQGWPKKAEFTFYATQFPTVEINATFYRLPSLPMARRWHDQAPGDFVFAVKGSRFLTHIKRLKDTGAGLRKFFSRLKPLAERTGPILWQLPPNFHKNEENLQRLDRFLGKLPNTFRHAIEFRHPSWMDGETMALLRTHHAANVWISSLKMPQDYTVTSDFVYLRFHGLKDGPYHDYTDAELAPWAKQLAAATRSGRPAFVYFNNDLNTRAPLNAKSLMRQLGRRVVPAFMAPQVPLAAIAPENKRGRNRARLPASRSIAENGPVRGCSRRNVSPRIGRPQRWSPRAAGGVPPSEGRTARQAPNVSPLRLRGRRPATATTG